jgi:3-mercaptopyruvate sulfurtransferase SseA
MDMASCQTKDYQEKLESLYNHTVPLIKTEDLARRINENNLVILDIRSEEEYQVSRIKAHGKSIMMIFPAKMWTISQRTRK